MEKDIELLPELHQAENLKDFFAVLSKYKKKYLICAAVKDSISRIDDESAEILMAFGMEDLRPRRRCGYVFVMDRGKIIMNESSKVDMALLRLMNVAGIELQIISKSFLAGNKANIVIEGYDLAANLRGLNVVVFDPKTRIAVDSVCFDFYPDSELKKVVKPFSRAVDFLGVPLPHQSRKADNCLDIDEEFDKIVEKYSLDEYYPNYSQMKKAKKAIRNLTDTWKPEENILCIIAERRQEKGRGEVDKLYFSENVNQVQINQIDFTVCRLETSSRSPLDVYTWNVFSKDVFKNINWKAYHQIYVISNYGSNFIGFWLRSNGVDYVCLKDYLLQYGIVDVGMEYYEYVPDKRENHFFRWNESASSVQWALYEESELYSLYSNDELRLFAAKKCFFLALSMKNFSAAKEWMKRIISLRANEVKYSKAWNEIQILLNKIKKCFKKRTYRDILAFWVDATGYADVIKDMPFVSSLQNKGIWFKNMIGLAGYTRETMRGVFAEKEVVDDRSHSIKKMYPGNSPLLRLLMKYDYQIRLSGTDPRSFFANQFITQKDIINYLPVSEKLWYAMDSVITSTKSVFSMIFIDDGHKPYLSCKMTDANVIDSNLRKIAAHKDVDEQIKYYFEIMGRSTTNITFCDHGDDRFWPREHLFFSICGDRYTPKIVNGIYSLIDFRKILEHLLEYHDIHEYELRRDYAAVQAVAVVSRNRKFVDTSEVMAEASPRFMPIFRGYRGIVTEKYIYLHFGGGREWLSRRDYLQPSLSWYKRPDDIFDTSLLSQMREMAEVDYGNEPPEYGEKIPYYLALQEQYDTNLPHNMRKVYLSNDMMERFPERSVAIYLGDKASYEWYLMLSLENRKKIVCVLDENKACLCSDLGLPVESLSKLGKQSFHHIIVTSRQLDDRLREALTESKTSIDVFGFYGWLEVNGYYTNHNLWDFAIQKWDRKPMYTYEIPDFFYYVSPYCYHEISVVMVVQDVSTLLPRLHDILRQTLLGMRIYCLDLSGKVAEVIKDYQKVESAIEIIPVDGNQSILAKLNDLISSVNSKYIFFLSEDEYLHDSGLFYLYELAEQTGADVTAAGTVAEPSKKEKSGLADFSKEALKKEAKLLAATFNERYGEWQETDIPSFAGSRLYRVDFLRQYNIRFPALKSGWKDIFCLQTIFESPKYVKAVSPVCISDGSANPKSVEAVSSAYARELVESMFGYHQAIERLLVQMNSFGNNASLCDKFRERAMTIFDRQYFSVVALDDETRKIVMQMVQEGLQKNKAIGMWWIKYLFMRSSFQHSV